MGLVMKGPPLLSDSGERRFPMRVGGGMRGRMKNRAAAHAALLNDTYVHHSTVVLREISVCCVLFVRILGSLPSILPCMRTHCPAILQQWFVLAAT